MIPYQKKPSLAIMNLIGAGNLGDELIALGFYLELRSLYPHYELHFFGYDLERILLRSLASDDHRLFFHHFFPHYFKKHPFKNLEYLFQSYKIIAQSEMLFIGGGGIFYDNESHQGVPKQLREWSIRTHIARWTRTKLCYTGIGIDISQNHINQYKPLFKHAHQIGLRDLHSQSILGDMGIHSTLESDLVIRMWQPITQMLQKVGWKISQARNEKNIIIGISLRTGLKSDDRDQIGSFVELLRKEFPNAQLIGLAYSHSPGSGVDDTSLLESLDLTRVISDPREIMEIIPSLTYMISMRLHAMITSHLSGVPTICLSYASKTREIAQELSSRGPSTPLLLSSVKETMSDIKVIFDWIKKIP